MLSGKYKNISVSSENSKSPPDRIHFYRLLLEKRPEYEKKQRAKKTKKMIFPGNNNVPITPKCNNYISWDFRQLKGVENCTGRQSFRPIGRGQTTQDASRPNSTLLLISRLAAQRWCCRWNHQQLHRAHQEFCRTSRP